MNANHRSTMALCVPRTHALSRRLHITPYVVMVPEVEVPGRGKVIFTVVTTVRLAAVVIPHAG